MGRTDDDVIERLGAGTDDLGLRVGQRVGYVAQVPGAYASVRTMPAERLVPLPDSISDEVAASTLLKGLTVELLVRRFYQAVIPDPVLGPIFHAMEVDWGVHIPKLVDFWSGRLLDIPGYEGNVAGAHLTVFDRRPFGEREMARWLELWHETLDELFAGPTVELAKARAAGAAEAITRVVRRRQRAGEPQLIGLREPRRAGAGHGP